MNLPTTPILISTSVTLLSLVVGIVSLLSLQSEEESRQLILASFPPPPVTYEVRETRGAKACIGTIHVSLDSGNNQAALRMQGWMMVSLFGRQEPLELDATLIFNALGQLSVSILKTTIQNESVRLGTTGVNPMTVQVYRGDGGSKPLVEQILPGPIELRIRKNAYELVAPQLPALRNVPRAPATPLTLEQAEATSCTREDALAFDLTPYLQMATALSENLRRIVPAL